MQRGIKVFLKGLILLFALFVIFIVSGFWMYHTMDRGKLLTNGAHKIDFLYSKSGHLIVDVMINGRPYKLLVDSGASNTVFSHRKDSIDLDGFLGFGIGIGINGGGFLTSMYRIHDVQIGNHQFEDLSFKVADFRLNCGEDIDGIIGKEAMRHLAWHFDPSIQEILISNISSDLPELKGDTVSLAINKYGHQLYAFGSVNGLRTKFTVDTGSNGFMAIGETRDDTLGVAIIGVGNRGLDGDSKEFRSWIFSESVRIQKFQPKAKIQVMTGNGLLPTIGVSFLKNYKFVLNWKERMLILEPLDSQSFISNSIAVEMKFDESIQKLVISSFLENSTLDQGAVLPGAVVECLNGNCNLTWDSYCNFKLGKEESLELKLEGIDSTFVIQRFCYDELVK